MGRLLHVSISVDIDRFSDRVLERDWLPMLDGIDTVEALRSACAEARSAGQVVFPNPDCTNVKPDGGCGGCTDPDDAKREDVIAAANAVVENALPHLTRGSRVVVVVTREDGEFVGVSSNTTHGDVVDILHSALHGGNFRFREAAEVSRG